jgi:hypothetical protein
MDYFGTQANIGGSVWFNDEEKVFLFAAVTIAHEVSPVWILFEFML